MGLNRELDAKLLSAAARGDADLARVLLNGGADPQARDGEGRTGMHLALMQDNAGYAKTRELVAMFLNRGVDINEKDGNGATVLHYAVQDESYGVSTKIRDLLGFGADIHARDGDGRTPLHWAARKSYRSETVKQLLDSGAQVDARDEQGGTPLHLAATHGDEGIIGTLLAAGADINAETKDGKKPWDAAVAGGQDYQAQWLKAEAQRLRRAEEKRRAEQQKKREAEKPQDPWSLLDSGRVACTTTDKSIGYRLTEIFNFSARTYTKIAQNLATKAEAVAVKSFDEFGDKTLLEKAHAQLERLGGKAERTLIGGPALEKPRRNLKLSAPGKP